MQATPVKLVKEFFHMPPNRPMGLPEMKVEWIQRDMSKDDPRKLTDEDKEQLLAGLGNGTLTY